MGRYIDEDTTTQEIDELRDIPNVDIVADPTDGEFLVFNTTTGKWEATDTIDGGTF